MNDNHLEETSDTILPIKNALGLPSEFLGEVIREFERACLAKNITGDMLLVYLENQSSWRIQAITIGCVSNVIIRNGHESEMLIPQLHQLGSSVVVTEVISVALNEREISQASSRKNKLKRSSTNTVNGIRKTTSKESYQNRPLPKNSNNTMTLALVGITIIGLALVAFLVMNSSQSNPEDTKNGANVENSGIDNNGAVEPAGNNNDQVKMDKADLPKEVDFPKPPIKTPKIKVPAVKKIVAEGTVVFQRSQPSFLGGTIVSYSFSRKKVKGPFIISGEKNKYFVVMRFKLENIPSDAVIDSADLKVNMSVRSKKGDSVNLYCLSSNYKWNEKSSKFNQASVGVKWSIEDFLASRKSSSKGTMTMQQDWLTFDVTNSIKKIVKGGENNGFILFTDSDATLLFLGFKSTRILASPKLVVTFKEKVKEVIKKNPVAQKDALDLGQEKILSSKENEMKDASAKESDSDGNDLKNIFENDKTKAIVKKPENDVANEDPKIKPEILEKIVPKVEFTKPIISSKSRLVLRQNKVTIENTSGKGVLRYSINKELSFDDSTVYDNGIKLSKRGVNIIRAAVFLKKKQVSDTVTQEFIKTNIRNEILVDNNSYSCKKIGRKWEVSSSSKGFTGSNYLFTTHKGNKVKWIPTIKKDGFYEVYASLPSGNGTRPGECQYKLYLNGGAAQTMNTVNQGLLSAQWAYLGKYELDKGKKSYVELTVELSSKITIADAMIFVKVEK